MKSYGSFFPVARAAEIVAQRWTPLVLRELMVGNRRFNDIRRGVPLMSPSLLARRLKALEDAGVVERRPVGAASAYSLTPAGEELRPVIEGLAVWARRWITRDYLPHELDPAVLLWNLRSHVAVDRFTGPRTVIRVELANAPQGKHRWWLIVRRGEVDVYRADPRYPVDVTLSSDVRTLAHLLLGDTDLEAALRAGMIRADPDALRGELSNWFAFENTKGTRAAASLASLVPSG